MAKVGRPPVTRARVLNYIAKHQPETIMQVARGTGVDRSYIYRVLRAVYGPKFRQRWRESAKMEAGRVNLPLAA